jgi:hypothetical protein
MNFLLLFLDYRIKGVFFPRSNFFINLVKLSSATPFFQHAKGYKNGALVFLTNFAKLST